MKTTIETRYERPMYRLDETKVELDKGLAGQVAEVLGIAKIITRKGRYDVSGCSNHCWIVTSCSCDDKDSCSCDEDNCPNDSPYNFPDDL